MKKCYLHVKRGSESDSSKNEEEDELKSWIFHVQRNMTSHLVSRPLYKLFINFIVFRVLSKILIVVPSQRLFTMDKPRLINDEGISDAGRLLNPNYCSLNYELTKLFSPLNIDN